MAAKACRGDPDRTEAGMAVQSTSSLTPRLATLSFVAVAQRSVTEFLTAQSTLNSTDGLTPARAQANAALRAQLSGLTIQSSASQVQASQMDVARTALEEVDSQLDSLAALIASIVTPTGSALEQAQAESIVSAVQSTLASALIANPNLTVPVALPAQITGTLHVEDIIINRIFGDIDDDGKDFALDVVTTGRQARLANALVPGGATFTNDVSFIVTGPDGSTGVINLTGGVSTRDDAINAINAFSDSTGVTAEASGANVQLRAVEYGVRTITILDVSAGGDPANEVASSNQTVAGTDASVLITDNDTGEQGRFTGDGRSIAFSIGGIEGSVELLKSSRLSDNQNPASRNFTVYPGGVPLTNSDGSTIARHAIPAFDFGRLGRTEGGLASIDLINDLGNALGIVTQAQSDLSDSLTVTEFLADIHLPNSIATSAESMDTANIALAEIDNFFDAIQLFDRVQAEARANGALSILSQLSSVFPASTLGLI